MKIEYIFLILIILAIILSLSAVITGRSEDIKFILLLQDRNTLQPRWIDGILLEAMQKNSFPEIISLSG